MPTFQSDAMKSKAAEIWDRLLGCFGESVLRKFGPEAPDEWVTGLWMLKPQQVERAFRRMNYQGMTTPPTLPMFMRLARSTGDPDDPDAAPAPAPQLTGPEVDKWEAQGNLWLLAYIRTEVTAKPHRYGQPASKAAMAVPKEMWPVLNQIRRLKYGAEPITDMNNLDASPEFVRNVARLVEAKKAWAADMRDLGQNDPQGRVPMDLAKATWADYIQFAEQQMELPPSAATGAPA